MMNHADCHAQNLQPGMLCGADKDRGNLTGTTFKVAIRRIPIERNALQGSWAIVDRNGHNGAVGREIVNFLEHDHVTGMNTVQAEFVIRSGHSKVSVQSKFFHVMCLPFLIVQQIFNRYIQGLGDLSDGGGFAISTVEYPVKLLVFHTRLFTKGLGVYTSIRHSYFQLFLAHNHFFHQLSKFCFNGS